ncbi:DegQ family serine endoprotease [Chitinimonas lacunae]|uniref:Probable periplasmic serine endoprotease DegP-like n=1 Tax=Chitinimonas lacunae TaxID=1963018 RepID=A0ABV8MQQ5_9NEIS
MMQKAMTATLFALGLASCSEASSVTPPPKAAPAPAAAVAASSVPLVSGLPDFSALVEKEGRAVVNISTTQLVRRQAPGMDDDALELFRRFGFPVPPRGQRPREERAQSLGSGFILDTEGYVLTNAHVIAEADEITVRLNDKREFKAKVVGSDARTDVALLKIDAKNLPKVDLGSSDRLKVGEWVVAIGSPFGLENTVTAGIVSAKGRNLPDEQLVPFIQTDAAVNPGNSGGPLFNVRGEVVGINSQIFSQSGGYMGLSFAIPIDEALQVVEQLRASGKVVRGRIGVGIQSLSEDLARGFGLKTARGALINNVEVDGPAGKAGARAGDVILKFNGREVNDSVDLPRIVGSTKPGSTVTMEVWRSSDKANKILTVTVGEMEQPVDGRSRSREYRGKQNQEPLNRSGLTVRDADPRALAQAGVKFGLQVVEARGAAAQAGLQPGDLLVGIGGEDIKNYAQLESVVNKAEPGTSVPLRVIRGQASLFVSLRLPEKGDDKRND